MAFALPDRFLNPRLLAEPMNWAIVWVMASIWLLLFHVLMQGWAAMRAPAVQPAFGGPGQVQAASSTADVFSQLGTLGGPGSPDLSIFQGGGPQYWTDGNESRYAEDGWISNP